MTEQKQDGYNDESGTNDSLQSGTGSSVGQAISANDDVDGLGECLGFHMCLCSLYLMLLFLCLLYFGCSCW